ncbi:hypothetical protein DVH05_000483 [Phytophthora capsici]|nr:hypothetical protein DVH05_012388 [Phytophthora capsici]KAG1712747.1 hypothetical protein DVH05_000483 [Phytophthora capsici]
MLTPRNPAALAPDVSDQGQDGGACTGGTATSGSSGGESVQVTSGTGKPLETIVAAASPQVSDGESKNASVDVSASKELCAFTVRSKICMYKKDGSRMEWLLDSRSQANVCSDLLSFVRMDTDMTHNLTMLNGGSEMNVACI